METRQNCKAGSKTEWPLELLVCEIIPTMSINYWRCGIVQVCELKWEQATLIWMTSPSFRQHKWGSSSTLVSSITLCVLLHSETLSQLYKIMFNVDFHVGQMWNIRCPLVVAVYPLVMFSLVWYEPVSLCIFRASLVTWQRNRRESQ